MPHIHDKIDFTVEVFIVYKNKVLLRKHDKYDLWLGVGGHIELDEDPNQAAVREVKEEVGLDINLIGIKPSFKNHKENYQHLITPKFLNRHQINPNHEHVTLTYFARSNTDNLSIGEIDDKSEACRWLTLEELEQNKLGIKEDIIYYANQALKELSK